MVGASCKVNGSNSILSQKRQRSSVSPGDGTKKRSLKLLNSELLDCPICYEPLTIPIFQCFRKSYGVYATVSCIAPCSPVVGVFSYEISYIIEDGHTITYESPNVLKILEVDLETPQENSMLIPHSLLRGELLEIRLCIKRLDQD